MKRMLVTLMLPLLLAACGLPKESVERSKTVAAETSAFAALLDKEAQTFQKFAVSPDAAPLVETLKREDWQQTVFAKAGTFVRSAQARKEETIDPLLKRNSSDDADKLSQALTACVGDLGKAKTVLANYQNRKTALLALVKDSDTPLSDSVKTVAATKERTKSFMALADSSSKDFPDKKDAVDADVKVAQGFLDTAETALAKAKAELSKKTKDYGIVADSFSTLAKADADSKKHVDVRGKRVGELRESHSKTLVDMRVEYFAQVTRVSWDEDSDWSTDQEHVYPQVKIDEDTARVLDDPKWDETPVATSSKRIFGSDTTALAAAVWSKIAVDLWYDRPVSHDMAEYYVDTSEKYYHKYRIERNGKVTTTDWVAVGENAFDSAEDFLGMALISKAYGMFEDETVKVPAPDGMEFVGNPAYGSWQNSSSGGGSLWQWYGQYAFIRDALGGHSYSRTEWDAWKRDYRAKKPYLGSEDEEDRYGTGGSVTGGSGHYRGSHYVSTGGVDRWRSYGSSGSGSQRGSGPDFRGRGPGGAGK